MVFLSTVRLVALIHRLVASLRRVARSPRRPVVLLLLLGVTALALLVSASPRLPVAESSPSSLHQWGAVTLFHGLPSDHVRAIAQDRDGTILLGTDSGLVRYDGRSVQKIQGFLSRRIWDVRFDQSGVAWIATDTGAARLIRGEAEPIRQSDGDSIRAIVVANNRIVLVGARATIYDCKTRDDGSLDVRKFEQRHSSLLSIDAGGNLAALELTSALLLDDHLLVGTHARGLLSFSASAELAEPEEVNSRPRPFFVEALARDRDGHVWFGAQTGNGESGLYSASDILHPVKVTAPTGTVTSLNFDQSGDVWVGTQDQGVFRFSNGSLKNHFTFENTAGGLRSNRIYSVFVDRESVVWFGTDRGACRFDPGGLSVEAVSLDAEANVIRELHPTSDGRVWCGTNRGLFVRDQSASWNAVPSLKNRTVHSIFEPTAGHLMIGTASGLFASSKGGEFVRVIDDPAWNVRALCSFQGSVFAGSFGRGLDRVNGNRRTLIWPLIGEEDGKPRNVVSLHADRDKLWIGTSDAGLFVYDGSRVSAASDFGLPTDAVVWSIEGSLDDALWLATSRGLFVWHRGRLDAAIENCDARCVVRASANVPDVVWCATSGCGLFKVRLTQTAIQSLYDVKSAVMMSKIDTEQGLPTQTTFSVAATSEASLVWIGTNKGVASYRPGGGPPLLTVSGATAGRHYTADEVMSGLVLEHNQGYAIDVAASSSRTFPEQFQYVFTFRDGRGKQVSGPPTRIPRINVDVMPSGTYSQEIRAYNVDLVESEPVVVAITIKRAPFPWTSTALSILLMLALVALAWGWLQNKRLIRSNVALAETRMQLANETETERRRIARDLHDQTLSDLRRLMLLTDQLPPGESGNGNVDPSKIRAEIESVSTEIRRICEDLSPSALANVGLAAALEWALADAVGHQPPEKKFEHEFVSEPGIDERLRLDAATQIQIYRIVQEAISNVSRHSGATHVKLSLAIESDGELVIELEDNGRGFDVNKLAKKGRGLTNIRSRSSLVAADVKWSAMHPSGSLFTLRMPPETAAPRSTLPV